MAHKYRIATTRFDGVTKQNYEYRDFDSLLLILPNIAKVRPTLVSRVEEVVVPLSDDEETKVLEILRNAAHRS